MSEAPLLPCPFCGYGAFMAPPNEDRPTWSIECAGYMKESRLVNCPGPTVEMGEQSAAIALWNTRAPRASVPQSVEGAEDALLAWFDQPVKYDAMGFTRTLRSIMERPEGEARFLEAAREYARLMTRDARNAHDPAKVQSEIDRARGEFYAAHKALETP